MRRTDTDETSRSFFRAQDRVFSLNGQWFFTTREGELGPFKTRETALKEVARFVQERLDLDRFQKALEADTGPKSKPTLALLPKSRIGQPDFSLEDLMLEVQR